MTDDYSPETRRALDDAGWTPGRQVDITNLRHWLESSGFKVSEAAERFLPEFVGLVFNISGTGITCARTPFEFNPYLAEGEDDRFNEWGEEIGDILTPLGELENGLFFLGITGSGEVCLVETWVASFGAGKEALENLVRGVRPVVIRK
ncbi:hypothetical protein FE257_004234 [Aspergillus nanangensis]|uniref:SUKH-3 immunity protein of toxin-antitoxin system n=1 Tax=Aspergillus nanangensis TaxID=2582783 RepID=A0AAD4CT94_ASPNN|nr:hypothetical protein FE257_004234 [Aspergillus nanangensis]